jgi:hypothetical protein
LPSGTHKSSAPQTSRDQPNARHSAYVMPAVSASSSHGMQTSTHRPDSKWIVGSSFQIIAGKQT